MSAATSSDTLHDNLVSADSHVVEVPDLWETGMSRSFRDRAMIIHIKTQPGPIHATSLLAT